MTTSPLFKKLKTHTVVAICAATIGLFSSTSAMAADMSNGANNFWWCFKKYAETKQVEF